MCYHLMLSDLNHLKTDLLQKWMLIKMNSFGAPVEQLLCSLIVAGLGLHPTFVTPSTTPVETSLLCLIFYFCLIYLAFYICFYLKPVGEGFLHRVASNFHILLFCMLTNHCLDHVWAFWELLGCSEAADILFFNMALRPKAASL